MTREAAVGEAKGYGEACAYLGLVARGAGSAVSFDNQFVIAPRIKIVALHHPLTGRGDGAITAQVVGVYVVDAAVVQVGEHYNYFVSAKVLEFSIFLTTKNTKNAQRTQKIHAVRYATSHNFTTFFTPLPTFTK